MSSATCSTFSSVHSSRSSTSGFALYRRATFVYPSADALDGANFPVLIGKFGYDFSVAKSKFSQSLNSHFIIIGYRSHVEKTFCLQLQFYSKCKQKHCLKSGSDVIMTSCSFKLVLGRLFYAKV